jgi:putative glutamine amidotransferase
MVDERRDRFEIALVRAARALQVPVLGLCRGVQLMNIALGGDIYQDIASQTGSEVRHSQTRVDDGPWHKVTIEPESRLGDLLGGGERTVNSFHHQACRRLGQGLAVSARSPQDGLIEALEDPSGAFFIGVQWHPELSPEADGPLFRAFVKAASRRRAAASK